MKNISKRLLMLGLSLILTVLTFNYNLQLISAEEDVTSESVVDMPSPWSHNDLKMLGIYDIVDTSMFSGFQLDATQQDMYIVGVKLYEKFTGKTVTDKDITTDVVALQNAVYQIYNIYLLDNEVGQVATRLDVATMLYRLIKKLGPNFEYTIDTEKEYKDVSMESATDSVRYLVAKELLKGSNDNLNLDEPCTKEQLLALASRIYYFAKQESGTAAKGAFWKVSGGKNTVYLLGSVHLADSRIYPMNDDILVAFEESDVLSIEADILGNQEGLKYLQTHMFYTDGSTIDQHISADLYKKYVEAMERYAISKEQYNMLKPWGASFLITNLEAASGNASYTAALGVDVFFMSMAENKKLIEIEGLKFQTDLLNGFSPEVQEGLLYSSLNPKSTDDGQSAVVTGLDNIFDVWVTGDVDDLLTVLGVDDTSADEFTTKFLVERNKHMSEEAVKYLESDEAHTYFIMVGAAHMVGESGMVKSLRDLGYTVDQIK